MSINLSLRFGLLLVVLGWLAVAVIACDRVSLCSRGDALASMDPQLREAIEGNEQAWMHDAKVCTVGQYQVIGPASGEDDTIFVRKDGKFVFAKVGGSTSMFKDGIPFVDLIRAESPAQSSMLSYTIYGPSSGSITTVMDTDLDGQADARMRSVKGQELRTEVWVEDRWRTMVRKDGQSGFVREGEFVPLALPETQRRGESQ